MRNRTISLLLSLVLTLTAILPLPALAAEEDPLVLQSQSDGYDHITYRYYADGSLAEKDDGTDTIVYTYWLNGTLSSEKTYTGRDLRSEVRYDQQGNMVLYREIAEDGSARTQAGHPEYDDYGRLKTHTVTGWYGSDGKLEEMYSVETYTVTYADEDSNEPLTLTFGTYEQDGNTANGPEPIEWQVLDVSGDYLLLLSRYGLDSQVYHGSKANVTWENSDMRKWLQGTFLNTAFSDAEQEKLAEIPIRSGVYDRVFLLTREDATFYLREKEDRICQATEYAVKRGAYVNKATGGSWWLLQTPGLEDACVMSVNSDGSMDYPGGAVNSAKGIVRPAVWVSAEDLKVDSKLLKTVRLTETYRDGSDDPISTRVITEEYRDGSLYQYNDSFRAERTGEVTESTKCYDSQGNPTSDVYIERRGAKNMVLEMSWVNKYDQAGQLVSKEETVYGEDFFSYRYRYDKAGRLISEVVTQRGAPASEQETREWRYDKNGRLLTHRINGEIVESCVYQENCYGRNDYVERHILAGDKLAEYYKENHRDLYRKEWQEEICLEYVYVPLSQALCD